MELDLCQTKQTKSHLESKTCNLQINCLCHQTDCLSFAFLRTYPFVYSSLCFVLADQSFVLTPTSLVCDPLTFVVLAQTAHVGGLFKGAFLYVDKFSGDGSVTNANLQPMALACRLLVLAE